MFLVGRHVSLAARHDFSSHLKAFVQVNSGGAVHPPLETLNVARWGLISKNIGHHAHHGGCRKCGMDRSFAVF